MDFLKKVKRYVLGEVRTPLLTRVPAGSQLPRHCADVACQARSALAPTVSCAPEYRPVLTASPTAQVGSLFHASLLVIEALAEVPGGSACAPLAAALTFACERTCARCHIARSRLQPGAESARAGTSSALAHWAPHTRTGTRGLSAHFQHRVQRRCEAEPLLAWAGCNGGAAAPAARSEPVQRPAGRRRAGAAAGGGGRGAPAAGAAACAGAGAAERRLRRVRRHTGGSAALCLGPCGAVELQAPTPRWTARGGGATCSALSGALDSQQGGRCPMLVGAAVSAHKRS